MSAEFRWDLDAHSHALLSAVQSLLEDPATPGELLPPVLKLLTLTLRRKGWLHGHFRDLADVLLGWSMDVALPPPIRAQIATLFHRMGPIW